MKPEGWQRLLADVPHSWQAGGFPIAAYSEFMPPPRSAGSPTGRPSPRRLPTTIRSAGTSPSTKRRWSCGRAWTHLAGTSSGPWSHLGHGRPAHGIARAKLEGNPYWPPELAERAGRLPHERYVVLAAAGPLADAGRQGPRPLDALRRQRAGAGAGFWRELLFGPRPRTAGRGRPWSSSAACWPRPTASRSSGWPICARPGSASCRRTAAGSLPYLATTSRCRRGPSPTCWRARRVGCGRSSTCSRSGRFGRLPHGDPPGLPGRRAALAALSRQPGVLGRAAVSAAAAAVAAGHADSAAARFATGTKPRTVCGCRSRAGCTSRIPTIPSRIPATASLRNTYRRTHRWARIHRHEDELAVADGEDRVAHVLFSTAPDDVGLYGKPMARNAQIWTHDFRAAAGRPARRPRGAGAGRGGVARGRAVRLPLPLSGDASRPARSLLAPAAGGLSGADDRRARGPARRPARLPDGLSRRAAASGSRRSSFGRGCWTASRTWQAVRGFAAAHEHHEHQVAINIRKLLDAWQLLGRAAACRGASPGTC